MDNLEQKLDYEYFIKLEKLADIRRAVETTLQLTGANLPEAQKEQLIWKLINGGDHVN